MGIRVAFINVFSFLLCPLTPSLPHSISLTPVIIIIAISEKCALYVRSALLENCGSTTVKRVRGKYIVFRARRRHVPRSLAKNGSTVVLLRVSLNKLWPKNTSRLTGYCYSRINLFFSFVLFPSSTPATKNRRKKCIVYRK